MNPTTVSEVKDVLRGHVPAAVLGAAIELGLFWELAEEPLGVAAIAERLSIPPQRCENWLDYLSDMGLLEETAGSYRPSATTRTVILESRSRDAWSVLAQAARDSFPALQNFPRDIRCPGSIWAANGLADPDLAAVMKASPDRARRFTRALYKAHLPLADELVQRLDMTGVERLMDLGGGSGVVAFALLRRYPRLSATVTDIENVCVVGREIAAENGLDSRIAYHPVDFLSEELPSGFDMVLKCDVHIDDEALYAKTWRSLNSGGRFILANNYGPAVGTPPPATFHFSFQASLGDPDFTIPRITQVRAMLGKAGFGAISEQELWDDGFIVEAHKD
jgi:SAM-dependent methyltransferase